MTAGAVVYTIERPGFSEGEIQAFLAAGRDFISSLP